MFFSCFLCTFFFFFTSCLLYINTQGKKKAILSSSWLHKSVFFLPASRNLTDNIFYVKQQEHLLCMPNPLQTALTPPWRGAQPWLIQAIFQAAFCKHLLALSLEYFSQSNVSQQSQNRSHNGTGNCLIAKLISQRTSEGNIQITFGRLLRLFLIPGAFYCFGSNRPATYSTSVQMNKPQEEISTEKNLSS